jgi:hypothetical protein
LVTSALAQPYRQITWLLTKHAQFKWEQPWVCLLQPLEFGPRALGPAAPETVIRFRFVAARKVPEPQARTIGNTWMLPLRGIPFKGRGQIRVNSGHDFIIYQPGKVFLDSVGENREKVDARVMVGKIKCL